LGASPVRVVFVTTVFEGTDTGPGTYARYLWRAFRDDPDLEFHLVAPEVAETHPRLHASGKGSGPLALYRRVQERGWRSHGAASPLRSSTATQRTAWAGSSATRARCWCK
jgi:hypothetical protein